jgi:hypothetical protein
VIYPGSTPVGGATLVVANVLTCNKYSPNKLLTTLPLPKNSHKQPSVYTLISSSF